MVMPRPATDRLFYRRHYFLLFCASVILALAGPWGRPHNTLVAFGMYGVLHSTLITMSLRGPWSPARKLVFVLSAGGLATLSVLFGMYCTRYFGTLGPELPVTLSSGLGAAAYGALFRLFWMDALSTKAIAVTTALCMLAVLGALTCNSALRAFGGLWVAAVWWFAFSSSLWIRDGLAARSRCA